MSKSGTLIAGVLLCVAGAGCGGASNPRAELSRVVVDYVYHNRGNCCELGMHATVSRVTFARSNPRWAAVSIAVTDINGRPDGRDFLVLQRTASTWRVVAFGKGTLGCHVPARLRAELAIGMPAGLMRC